MKLALKLSLFIVLGMCLVLALDSLTSIRRELGLHAADVQQDEHVTGRAVAAAMAEVWTAQGRASALALLDRASSAPVAFRWIELDAPAGSRFAPGLAAVDLGPVGQGREVHRVEPRPHGAGRAFTYLPLRVDGTVRGAIELSEPIDDGRYVRATLLQRVAITTAFALLSGLIAVLVGGGLVGRPIRTLVGKARRIAAGEFPRPLGLVQNDEIGVLGREIDAMCERLANAHDRILAETAARIDAIEQVRHTNRLATVGTLASGVAHELGTPLNVVSVRAKMIAGGEVQGADAAAGAQIIAEQAQRMTSVLRQLLDFARLRRPEKTGTDLASVARQTAAMLAPLASRRGVRIAVHEGAGITRAPLDAGLIQQALTNLVMNAIQAMEAGEVSITVGTRPARAPADRGARVDDWRFVSVLDRGAGIAREHLGRLFEPFFTTKEVGQGTGLGLAVAYGIARDHGGWIDVVSAPGSGSCFTIYLPRDLPAARPAAPATGPAPLEGRIATAGARGDDRP